MNLQAGLYRHYKGNQYFVFQVAHHSETREPMVIYQCLYGDYSWWVRPLTMFTETIFLDGQIVPRFLFLREFSASESSFLVSHKVDDSV